MTDIGLESAKSGVAHSMDEAWEVQRRIAAEVGTSGFPAVIRPSFTMGGSGGGIAYNAEEFETICRRGLEASPTSELLIEESLLGWKEFEMEVVRDKADNCIIVCSIENLDPMGAHRRLHHGGAGADADGQGIPDHAQRVDRRAARDRRGHGRLERAVRGQPEERPHDRHRDEPARVAFVGAGLQGHRLPHRQGRRAPGRRLTLDELKNEITGGATPASFEPSIDYVVTKVPRFAFEKFPTADARLTTQMKSVGEVMAIGRTFQESFQALRGLEVGVDGLNQKTTDREKLQVELGEPGPERIWYVGDAFAQGFTLDEVHNITHIDPWFLSQIKEIVDIELALEQKTLSDLDYATLWELKRRGFSDRRLAFLLDSSESEVRKLRHQLNVRPVYKRVDTCAAEFATRTAYMYSTYEEECEAAPTDRKKIVVLGGGPNRIGQGIEFDYCCVHAALGCATTGSRPSWSTATRKPCPPTTTPPTACTSSR